MEKEKLSIWHRNLNLIFVYVSIFLFGLIVVYLLSNFLNYKVEEINAQNYQSLYKNM